MEEINLYDLIKYYIRNWLLLLIAVLTGTILGLVYTNFIQTPLYKSSATLLVVDEKASQDTSINNNYKELFKSRRVLDQVIIEKGYSGDYNKLLSLTTATNDKDTDVIRVSISDPNAKKSEVLLASALESFKKETTEIYGADNVKVIDAASSPTAAYNVSIYKQTILATLASVLLMVIVLFFMYDYQFAQKSPQTPSDLVSKQVEKNPNKLENSKIKAAPSKTPKKSRTKNTQSKQNS